ncbi:MAG: methylenetetrahydrofolate reductase [Desulfobacteraceae bacterium]|jgi:5,10-methylenetetrahydrofolate reductase
MCFYEKMTSGEFVVVVELSTPKGVDVTKFLANANKVRGRVDAVVVSGLENGVMRMGVLAGGAMLHDQGLETIIHICCRDLNRMALQSELLAAHALGLHNLIVIAGEDMVNGDHKDAKAVDDLDEIGLLGAIKSLQQGVDLTGFTLKGSPNFYTGCAIEPFADESEMMGGLASAGKKIMAGAQYIVTPPVFDVDQFETFLTAAEDLNVPIIAPIFLIKSVGAARYIAINQPGSHISEDLIDRIRKSADRKIECLRIAGEILAGLKDKVAGVKLVTAGWEDQVPAVLDIAGL